MLMVEYQKVLISVTLAIEDKYPDRRNNRDQTLVSRYLGGKIENPPKTSYATTELSY